jgi:hypothetical protein
LILDLADYFRQPFGVFKAGFALGSLYADFDLSIFGYNDFDFVLCHGLIHPSANVDSYTFIFGDFFVDYLEVLVLKLADNPVVREALSQLLRELFGNLLEFSLAVAEPFGAHDTSASLIATDA